MLNSAGEVVEQKWKDLVDTFCRKEKSGPGGMTIEGKLASWKFYDRMSFMHPYIQSRRLFFLKSLHSTNHGCKKKST